MKSLKMLSVLSALLVLTSCLGGCKDKGPEQYPVTVAGETVEQKPTAVVVISPVLCEISKLVGAGDVVVGICEGYTAQAFGSAKTVGTAIEPDVDAIVKLSPQYLLTAYKLPQSVAVEILQAGVKILEFEPPENEGQVEKLYLELARFYLGKADGDLKGAETYDSVTDRIAAVRKACLDRVGNEPLGALYVKTDFGLCATKDVYESRLLSSLALDNLTGEAEKYDFDLEKIAEANPDVILVANDVGADAILNNAKLSEVTAVKNGAVYVVNSAAIDRCGETAASEIERLANLIYPDLYDPPVSEEPESSEEPTEESSDSE